MNSKEEHHVVFYINGQKYGFRCSDDTLSRMRMASEQSTSSTVVNVDQHGAMIDYWFDAEEHRWVEYPEEVNETAW